jgi:hypothetical protein
MVHIYIHALGLNIAPSSAALIVSIYGICQIVGNNASGVFGAEADNRASSDKSSPVAVSTVNLNNSVIYYRLQIVY